MFIATSGTTGSAIVLCGFGLEENLGALNITGDAKRREERREIGIRYQIDSFETAPIRAASLTSRSER
jgi:hypothetical protein